MSECFDFYVAGPMRGKPDGNKPLFIGVAKFLRSCGYTVWNPAEQNDRHMTFAECIGNDIDAVVNECRSIALLPDWEKSLGANVEALCAYVCDKKIYYITLSKDGGGYVLRLVSTDEFLKNFKLPFSSSEDFRPHSEFSVPEKEILEQ